MRHESRPMQRSGKVLASLRAAAAVLALACAGAGNCLGAEVDSIAVTDSGDSFKIVFNAAVDAPAARVYAVLSDYTRLGKLNPVITAMSVQTAPDGHTDRVRSVIRSCVWFFCREIVQVEDVIESNPNLIRGRIVPGLGDFEGGSFFWRITPDGARTRLHYEATRVADFWIPPLIGPWAVKHTLQEQLTSSIVLLERLANEAR